MNKSGSRKVWTSALITVNEAGEAAQVEKVSYETAMGLLASFGKVVGVGPSLGSFSMSNEMLTELLSEFKTELAQKTAKMDSDPHFWMPLTLDETSYVSVMVTKDETASSAAAHHKRMSKFKTALLEAHPDKGLLGGDRCRRAVLLVGLRPAQAVPDEQRVGDGETSGRGGGASRIPQDPREPRDRGRRRRRRAGGRHTWRSPGSHQGGHAFIHRRLARDVRQRGRERVHTAHQRHRA